MKTNDDWSAAAKELLAELRTEFVGHVPDEPTLLAYVRGELPGAEADEVREFLALYPEVASALADDPAEPPAIGPGHPAYQPPRERAAAWQNLAARLGIEDEGPRRPLTPEPILAPPVARQTASVPRWWGIAASVVAATLGVLYFQAARELADLRSEPRLEAPWALSPDATRGPAAGPSATSLETAGREIWLILTIPGADALARYRVELRADSGGRGPSLWTGEDAAAQGDGTLHLVIPRKLLPAGVYQIRVESGSGEALSYTFRIP